MTHTEDFRLKGPGSRSLERAFGPWLERHLRDEEMPGLKRLVEARARRALVTAEIRAAAPRRDRRDPARCGARRRPSPASPTSPDRRRGAPRPRRGVRCSSAHGRRAIVGAIVAAWDGWRGSIYRLAVLEDHRRDGARPGAGERGRGRCCGRRGARRIQALVYANRRPGAGLLGGRRLRPGRAPGQVRTGRLRIPDRAGRARVALAVPPIGLLRWPTARCTSSSPETWRS